MNLKETIRQRKQFLSRLLKEKTIEVNSLPSGNVRANKHKKAFQYYLVDKVTSKNGIYIPAKEISKVQKMVLHEYDTKVIKSIHKELNAIKPLENTFASGTAEDIYEKMPKGKQVLITPIVETEEQFVNRWLSKTFPPSKFSDYAAEYYSQKGVRMRSKSEVIISGILDKLGINYLYELPLSLNNGITVHPDFTIIDGKNHRIIIHEHFGMMDDKEYANDAIGKIKLYQQNGWYIGINLIATFETSKHPLDTKSFENLLLKFISSGQVPPA